MITGLINNCIHCK